MLIGNHNTDDKVFLIAEIGNNHEGDFDLACEMIQLAADAGADAVKFQTIVPERLVAPSDTLRVEQLRRFQFTQDQFSQLRDVAVASNVVFMSTPFDVAAIDWLDPLVPAFKIASGDNDFWPLIDRAAKTGKPLIISMGFGQSQHANKLVQFVNDAWSKHGVTDGQIGLLHCVVSYPTPPQEAALAMLRHLDLPAVTIGYSDHTIGIRAAELAVAAGARIIEKHFTIDKNHSDFRDHQLSADPSELTALVDAIANVEQLFGREGVVTQACETKNEMLVRRSIAAVRDMDVGETVRWEDLCWLRPRRGLKPGEENLVCGRMLRQPHRLWTSVYTRSLRVSSVCGIAGYFGTRRVTDARAQGCLRLMQRRGPDASGTYRYKTNHGPQVLLLHSRLKIIDFDQRADQPFVCGESVLAFNGELYNYLELREQLRTAGCKFATESDTEVLAQTLRSGRREIARWM